MTPLFHRLRRLVLAVALGVVMLCWGAPALADAGRFLSSQSAADLEAAITATRDPQRLADLQALQSAVASSGDRAQLSNASSHSLGVFARYKKEPADTPASFYVLGPGHDTDDDYELVGLLVPPQVALNWGEAGHLDAAPSARVARILEGQQLQLSDPAEPAADGAAAYQLSLPVFRVDSRLAGVAEVPALSQQELDLAPETAPLD